MQPTNQVKLPDYLLELTDKVEESIGLISSGVSVPRISIRGRQFRFVVDGEEVLKQTEPIHIIILGVEPDKGMAKTFYASGYQPGSSDPPDCSSWDGVSPDSWVDRPQSDFCANCEKNIWGSATALSGKKAKACKESKRLMVVDTKDVKGQVYIFNVTIASLKALSEYGKFLISNNIPMAAAITQIAFVDSEFPQVEFNFAGILNKDMGTLMLKRSNDKEWKADINLKLPQSVQQKMIPQTQLTPNIPISEGVVNSTYPVQPVAQLVAQPVAQPIAQPIAQPVTQPVAQLVSDKSIDDLLADWD